MLVHIKELFSKDVVGKFAFPAFNTMDLEITQGIVRGAEEANAPVILEVSEGAIKYAGLEALYEVLSSLAKNAKVPVALHMDHGKDMEQLKKGIELGFSSVMIDHSSLPFEENVANTKAMVEFAHSRDAWVQGEMGKIRGSEDWVNVAEAESLLTEVEEAEKFVSLTGVDTFAGSFGTIHGIAKIRGGAEAHVNIERIREVASVIKRPIVLHGASGVPEDVVDQAILAGVAIINIDTELRIAFSDTLRKTLESKPDEIDPRNIFKPSIEAVKEVVVQKIGQFGTSKYFL